MKLDTPSIACLFVTSLVAACSDGGNEEPSNCLGGGHGSKPTCGPWADDVPEGGEFRIELQTNGSDGSVTAATHGYFYKDQTPARRALGGPEVVAGTGCVDMTKGVYFDNGAPAASIELANTRTYLDLGAQIKIKSTEQTHVLERQSGMMDLSSYLMHDIVYLPASTDGADYLRNKQFQVEWDPASEMGAMDMTEPTAVQGVQVPSQLFVPPAMTNISPSLAAPLAMPASGDLTFTYDLPERPADAPPLLQFAVFFNPATGGVDYQCVNEEPTGTLTVPRALIEKLPGSGYLYFGTYSHVGHKQADRRLDLVGVSCTYQEFTK